MSDDTINTTITNNNGEMDNEKSAGRKGRLWPWSGRKAAADPAPEDEFETGGKGRPTKWSMGVLNDPRTHEVPGMPPSSYQSRLFSRSREPFPKD